MESRVFSVSEVNERIKQLFELDPVMADICVAGEISNYKVYPSGHHYFTLKDSESSLRCVMFKGNALRLKFRPDNGMKVTIFGRISVYPRDGAYQLYCTAMLPEGLGLLQQRFEQLKAKLSAEGLFGAEHKKPLPEYPATVAVITSPAGAAVRDIIRILGQRWPMAKVLIIPVRVQGTEAPGEIASAIRLVNENKLGDVIITGRGGGSIEDLWAFNEEIVARAIFASRIPVISAVGHEPDVTIADYVADKRASTPSNAAELAVKDKNEQLRHIAAASSALDLAVSAKIESCRSRISRIDSRYFGTTHESIIDAKRMELDRAYASMTDSLTSLLLAKRAALTANRQTLEALGPVKVLKRGYAIAQKQGGAIIRTASDVLSGEKIKLIVADGEINCTAD